MKINPYDYNAIWLTGDIRTQLLDDLVKSIQTASGTYPGHDLMLFINSAGGISAPTLGITALLELSPMPIDTVAVGLVGSMGVSIYMCGRKRYMCKNSLLHLHDITRVYTRDTSFNLDDLKREATEVEAIKQHYAQFIAERTGGKQTTASILKLMAATSYLNAQQACELGFAHEIVE